MSLISHIENGFQNKLKLGGAFLDVSFAYDTIWKNGLLLKLARVLKFKTKIRLLERILSDRNFKVHFNGKIGKKKQSVYSKHCQYYI